MVRKDIVEPLALLLGFAFDAHSLCKQEKKQFSPIQGTRVCLHHNNGNRTPTRPEGDTQDPSTRGGDLLALAS